MQNSNNEIDLIELIVRFVTFFRRNIIILFISLLIGLGYGTYKTISYEPYYETSFIAILDIPNMPDEIIINRVNNLQIAIEQNKYKLLAEVLDISDSCANKIISINASKLDIPKSEIQNSINANISISFYDNYCNDNIKNSIGNYIQKSEIIKSYFSNKVKKNKLIISKIDEEIIELDQFQKKSLEAKSDNNTNLSHSHVEIIHLLEKKITLQNDISNFGISFIDNQVSNSKHSINVIQTLLLYGIGFFIIGFIITSFIHVYSSVKKRV